MVSAQNLLTPLLESFQTLGVDDPYLFSGHMVKGQGQTAGLCKNDVCSISFNPFAGKSQNCWSLRNVVFLTIE